MRCVGIIDTDRCAYPAPPLLRTAGWWARGQHMELRHWCAWAGAEDGLQGRQLLWATGVRPRPRQATLQVGVLPAPSLLTLYDGIDGTKTGAGSMRWGGGMNVIEDTAGAGAGAGGAGLHAAAGGGTKTGGGMSTMGAAADGGAGRGVSAASLLIFSSKMAWFRRRSSICSKRPQAAPRLALLGFHVDQLHNCIPPLNTPQGPTSRRSSWWSSEIPALLLPLALLLLLLLLLLGVLASARTTTTVVVVGGGNWLFGQAVCPHASAGAMQLGRMPSRRRKRAATL